jgi:dolichol-phosphate mannosyltransferase
VIFVVVPTYNERDNLPRLIDALLRIAHVNVLIVDDGSPDGTGEAADRLAASSDGRVQVLHRSGQRGLGRSYIDGFQHVLRLGATRVCQMDADFSHDPNDVPRLLEATESADLAIGSRYVPGGTLHNWPWHRVVLSAFANRYVRTITGIPVHDATSGFRCWRAELLAQVPLPRIVSEGYAFQVEMAWHASLSGARIVEVPIRFVERLHGASKLSGQVILESAVLPWRLRVAARQKTR